MVECLTPQRGATDLKGHRFDPQQRRCVVSLSKNINPIYTSSVLVQPRKTRPFITERLLMGRKESNQTKQRHRGLISPDKQLEDFI